MKYLRVSRGSSIFVPLSDNMEKRYLRFPSLTTEPNIHGYRKFSSVSSQGRFLKVKGYDNKVFA